MVSRKMKTGDAGNTGFGFREHVVHHKPGFEHQSLKRELETGGNHRFRPSEQKDVPRESLSDRIDKGE